MYFAITAPSAVQIAAAPREYSLFAQAHKNGEFDAERFVELAKKYGDGTAATQLSGTVPFEDAVKALKAGPSKWFSTAESITEHANGSQAIGICAHDDKGVLAPFKFTRRAPGPKDVSIQIAKAGICHSDYHVVHDEWKAALPTFYPVVPGHEIVGVVTAVGAEVTKLKVGDFAGVGCMVDSCRTCEPCVGGDEQYCNNGILLSTYNCDERDVPGVKTKGGYSDHIVVDEHFVLKVPDNLSLAGAAPLLCAGITVYSPLRHFGLDKPGMKIGVVGLGGLGHMAVKIAKAMGCEVTVLSTSESKREEAAAMGADHFDVSKDAALMKEEAGSLDGILDTVSANHPLPLYLDLLKLDGKLVLLGVPPDALPLPSGALIFRRRTIAGSLIGGIRETQEMLDFCGKHNIVSEIEEINADYINTAYERLIHNDVHYRFVIDVQGTMVQ